MKKILSALLIVLLPFIIWGFSTGSFYINADGTLRDMFTISKNKHIVLPLDQSEVGNLAEDKIFKYRPPQHGEPYGTLVPTDMEDTDLADYVRNDGDTLNGVYTLDGSYDIQQYAQLFLPVWNDVTSMGLRSLVYHPGGGEEELVYRNSYGYRTVANQNWVETNFTTETEVNDAVQDILDYHTVNVYGNQTINGDKTFNGKLIAYEYLEIPHREPEAGEGLVNLGAVDIGGGHYGIAYPYRHGLRDTLASWRWVRDNSLQYSYRVLYSDFERQRYDYVTSDELPEYLARSTGSNPNTITVLRFLLNKRPGDSELRITFKIKYDDNNDIDLSQTKAKLYVGALPEEVISAPSRTYTTITRTIDITSLTAGVHECRLDLTVTSMTVSTNDNYLYADNFIAEVKTVVNN